MSFAVGTVGYMLNMMNGIWHDHIELYDLSGSPIDRDEEAESPGASPFDNLVYIDFDGEHYIQTNVTFRGRPLHVRTFTGRLIDGILHFDKLGPDAPLHIGVSAGNNVLAFMPAEINDALKRYSEPDFVFLEPPNKRTRSTVLYRDTKAIRSLHAQGYKLAPTATHRHADDPRGLDGDVHEKRSSTQVFTDESTHS